MPIFGRHYQRGSNIPKETIVGYAYVFSPTQTTINTNLMKNFDVSSVVDDTEINLDASGSISWAQYREEFYGDLIVWKRRYFSFLDSGGHVITDDSGISVFYTKSREQSEHPTEYRLAFEPAFDGDMSDVTTISLRKRKAYSELIVPRSSINVLWQTIFTDEEIPNEQNNGYGWEYIMLPLTGQNRFEPYNYWSPVISPDIKSPIYPYDDIPVDIGKSEYVLLQTTMTWAGNIYQLIYKRGYGRLTQPTLLSNLTLFKLQSSPAPEFGSGGGGAADKIT
jgi:hypothetical protein